jgi:hypothetical protein
MKVVDVSLRAISCDRNDFGGVVQISGDTYSMTFNNNPENLNDVRERQSVYPFPNGPIGLSEGQTHSIKMRPVSFLLTTSSDPPGLVAKFLKFGGELNLGLGSNFQTIRFDDILPVDTGKGEKPKEFPLTFVAPNITVTLTFGVISMPPF